MSGDDKPIVKKRKWLRLLLLLPVLLVIIMIVLSRIPGERPGQSVLSEMWGTRPPAVTVSELNFDVGRSRVFAHAEGSVAAAGTLGLQVLGPDGRETLRESIRISAPALVENNGLFIAFDIGGTAIRVFSALNMQASIETEAPVVSASVNSNGWYCIVTQPQAGGSRGIIDVYNNIGKHVYNIMMGSGYVLSAKLSDDNRNLAILNVTETGSRISLYSGIDTDKDSPDNVFELGSEIFLELDFLSDTSILAFGNQSVLTVDIEAGDPYKTLCSFDGKRLGGYTNTGSFVAVHLYDFGIGYSGQVISMDFDGNVLGQLQTSQEINSMTSCGSTLMLLGSDKITFYTAQMEELPLYDDSLPSAAAAGRAVALSEDMVLVATDLSANVVRLERSPPAGDGG